jgi:hypothetical protein
MSDTESPPEALPTYFGVNPPVEAVAGSSAANQYQAAPDDPDFIQILDFKDKLMQNDEASIREGASGINRLLCRNDPPIHQTIAAGVVPKLIELASHPNEDILYPSLWALSNVASGGTKDVMYLLDHGTLELFKRRLEDCSLRIREQAAWGIGNIAGDSPKLRNMCLAAGVMPLILELCLSSQTSPASVAVWVLSNLCRGSPPPVREDVVSAILVVAKTLTSTNQEILVDSLWALGYLAKGVDKHQVEVASCNVIPTLIHVLKNPRWQQPAILVPALQAVGHLMAGPDHVTQRLLDAGVVDILAPFLSHRHSGVTKDAYWTLSNLCAGTPQQVKAAAFLIPLAIDRLIHLENTPRRDVLIHISFCVTNAASGADPETLKQLLDDDIFHALVSLLTSEASFYQKSATKSTEVLISVIEAIGFIIRKPAVKTHPKVVQFFPMLLATCDELTSLDDLQDPATMHALEAIETIIQSQTEQENQL